MTRRDETVSDEAARAIWRRAAELQAEAERRMEERARQLTPQSDSEHSGAEGVHPDEIRAAAIEAGISPEFVQIALAEAAAAGSYSAPLQPWELSAARIFLFSTERSVEVSTLVSGSVDSTSAAVMKVFAGHPCLLQPGDVADLPSSEGRVVVFNVPKYDWGATANPPFIERAAMVGLRQLHVAVRPVPGTELCEVVVAGDLHPGLRKGWRISAATSAAAGVAGGTAGIGIAASAAVAGALLVLPAVAGIAAAGSLTAAIFGWSYRYYRKQVEESLRETLGLLNTTVRVVSMSAGRIGGHSQATASLPPATEAGSPE